MDLNVIDWSLRHQTQLISTQRTPEQPTAYLTNDIFI